MCLKWTHNYLRVSYTVNNVQSDYFVGANFRVHGNVSLIQYASSYISVTEENYVILN
jgi:hypothetical protein